MAALAAPSRLGLHAPPTFSCHCAINNIKGNASFTFLHLQASFQGVEFRQAQILEALEKYDTLVLVGETGSGKTTQLPQFLFEAG